MPLPGGVPRPKTHAVAPADDAVEAAAAASGETA